MSDARLSEFLELFRRAADYLESPELAKVFIERTGAEEEKLDALRTLCLLSLIWTARQLRAIALLLQNGMALEGEPLVRALLELTVNLAWVGKDLERAEQIRDEGISSMRTWMEAMEGEMPGFFPPPAKEAYEDMLAKSTGKENRLPRHGERAKSATPPNFKPGLVKRMYDFSYRRLSASVHVDTRAFDLLIHSTDALPRLDAQETAVAAAVAIRCAADVLGLMPELGPLTSDLFRLAEESQRWPRPGSP